jgi:hypothetical protein
MIKATEELDLRDRFERIERMLNELLQQRQVAKEWYTVEEIARLLEKSAYTVREEWCNRGRINARKSFNRAGRSNEWVIAHAELLRYQREGLLPPDPTRNRCGRVA